MTSQPAIATGVPSHRVQRMVNNTKVEAELPGLADAIGELNEADTSAFQLMLNADENYVVATPADIPVALRSFRVGYVAELYARARYFHGSSKENLGGEQGIMRTGLDPAHGGEGGASDAIAASDPETSEYMKKFSTGFVHFSIDFDTADEYAESLADGRVVRVFLSPDEISALAVDTSHLPEGRKTQRAVPAKSIRPRSNSVAGLAADTHAAESVNATKTAILAHDPHGAIPAEQFDSLVEEAHRTLRLSFRGLDVAEVPQNEKLEQPVDDEREGFGDVEGNQVPVAMIDFTHLVTEALKGDQGALENLDELAENDALWQWLHVRLQEQGQALDDLKAAVRGETDSALHDLRRRLNL